MSDTTWEPAPDKAGSTVELNDAFGEPIGVTVRLKGTKEAVEAEEGETPEHLRLREIAANVAEWSAMEVDGEPWTFGEHEAVVLFHRFPIFADQIEAGIRKA